MQVAHSLDMWYPLNMKNALLGFCLLIATCHAGNAAAPNRSLALLAPSGNAGASAVLLGPEAVLTAAHAVREVTPLFVCGKERIKGSLVRLDALADLALLALEKPCNQVDVTPMASVQEPDGAPVYTQGYPGTNARHTSAGIVASHEVIESVPPRLYMVMDVRISAGNSGGPVINSAGLLVGIVHGKICFSPEGPGMAATCYGLAVPITVIKDFLQGLNFQKE